MGHESTLNTIIDFVSQNPWLNANQISDATGIQVITVHRQLTGGYKQISAGTFIRKKITRRLPPNKNGQIRGSYCYVYAINPDHDSTPEHKPEPVQVEIKHHPLHNAFFGVPA